MNEAALNDGDALELGAVPLVFLADWDAEATMVSNMQANAEIRVDGQSFPVVAIEGRRLRIGRRSPDGSYRPDIDLRDVPGSATVSHLHGHVYRRADEWMWHVVKTMNGTMIAGREVQPGEDVPLADGDPLRLGRVRATFHQRPVVRVVGNELLSLSMTPEELSLEAGTTHTGRISLVNVSGRVEQVMLELTGIPEEWFVLALPDGSTGKSLNLQLLNAVEPNQPLAGSAAQVAVTFAPPKVPESRAGIYPVSVSATTRGEEQVRRVATSKLHVLPFEGLELTVGPEEIKGTRGAYWAEVHNTGNAEVNVNLNVETRGKVKVDTPQQQVRLPNGGQQRIPLPMKVARRHWLGFDQTYGVDITATAGGQRRTGSVRMVVASWLPRWAQFIVGKVYAMASPIALPVVTVAILLGVAYFLLRPPDVKDFRAEPASIVAGDAAQLVWTLDRAAGVTIEPPVGDKLSVPEGSLAVLPAARTEYTLTARNWLGISSSAKYTVDVLQIGAFKATPERLNKEGDEVTLQWETQGAQRVKIEPENDIKDPKPNGDAKVRPSASTTYVLTATGVGGVTTSAQVGVSIGAPNITRFDVVPTPRRPYQGDPIQLTWTVDGATRVDIGVDKGEVAPGKPTLDVTGGPPATAYPATDGEVVYTLTAANAAGSVQRTLSVPVARVGITSFDVDRTTVAADTPVTLRWRVEGANDRTKSRTATRCWHCRRHRRKARNATHFDDLHPQGDRRRRQSRRAHAAGRHHRRAEGRSLYGGSAGDRLRRRRAADLARVERRSDRDSVVRRLLPPHVHPARRDRVRHAAGADDLFPRSALAVGHRRQGVQRRRAQARPADARARAHARRACSSRTRAGTSRTRALTRWPRARRTQRTRRTQAMTSLAPARSQL